MPPPKRPKSDVQWSRLCIEAEWEPDGCNVEDNWRETSVNAHVVDDTIVTLNAASSAPCTELVPAVSCDMPLDLRRTDAVPDGDRFDTDGATGSRQLTTSTSLRRLLMEPLTPAPDLHRQLLWPTFASAAAAETQRKCQSKTVGKTAGCTTNQNNVALNTQPVADLPAAADDARWQAGGVSSSNLPSATLRRMLLSDDDVDDGRKRAKPSVTGRCQSSDFLLLRLASGGSCSSWSSSSTGSADGRASLQQSASNRDVSQTASSLLSNYVQLTGRLESRDSGKQSKSTEQRREKSAGLK